MNEFIANGLDGLLTDFTQELPLKNIKKLWTSAKLRYKQNYEKSHSNFNKIVDFLDQKIEKITYPEYKIIIDKFLYNLAIFGLDLAKRSKLLKIVIKIFK